MLSADPTSETIAATGAAIAARIIPVTPDFPLTASFALDSLVQSVSTLDRSELQSRQGPDGLTAMAILLRSFGGSSPPWGGFPDGYLEIDCMVGNEMLCEIRMKDGELEFAPLIEDEGAAFYR